MNAPWPGSDDDLLSLASRSLMGVTVILTFALLLSILARRSSAAARHRVWGLAVAAVLLLPGLIAVAPQYRLGLLSVAPRRSSPHRVIESATLAAPNEVPSPAEVRRLGSLAPTTDTDVPDRTTSMPRAVSRTSAASAAAAPQTNWGTWAFIGWALGSGVILARMFGAFWSARRLVRRSSAIDDSVVERLLHELAAQLEVRRLPVLLQNGETASPLCLGVRRAKIILPIEWPTWSRDNLRAALSHELAHVLRRDVAWQWLACWACSWYWFHPLIWWAARRMRMEREIACDDCVLNAGERPTEYAMLLFRLGSAVRARTDRAPLSAVAMASRSQLESRIRDVLRAGRCRAAVSRSAQRKLAIGIAALVAALAIVHPFSASQREPTKEAERDANGQPSSGRPMGVSNVQRPAGATFPEVKEIARELAAVYPGWTLREVDADPRALADGFHGHRIVLRRTWREYTGPAQQRAEVAPAESAPASLSEERSEDWEFVLVPVAPSRAPDSFKSRIEWQPSTSPYHTRDICLGEGLGQMWFTRGTIPLQQGVRDKFQLQGGDDPIQLAADGLLVEDTGTNTANSSIHLLAAYGDQALPYVEKAIEEAHVAGRDVWHPVMGLSQIHTQAATDMLVQLYATGDEPWWRPAAYALIHKPYRQSAKQTYLAMLRDHVSVEQTAEACVEFAWAEAIPILKELIAKPRNLRELQHALHARRALEGRPIARELLDAEPTLRKAGQGRDAELERQIAAARELLIRSDDAEPANLAALMLASFANKADVTLVRQTGIEILKLRPRDDTLAFLRNLANSIHEDERRQIEQILHAVAE